MVAALLEGAINDCSSRRCIVCAVKNSDLCADVKSA